jgi:primosomal protein N'
MRCDRWRKQKDAKSEARDPGAARSRALRTRVMDSSSAVPSSSSDVADHESSLAERDECSGGHQATGLQKAAAQGDLKSIMHTLDSSTVHGQLDSVDANGRTALMLAAERGHTQVVRALLMAGVDVDLVTADGLDAAGLAEAHGHTEPARAIRAEQASRSALWAAITQDQQASAKGASASRASSTLTHGRNNGDHADVMAKLLAEAGLPSGPKESPF